MAGGIGDPGARRFSRIPPESTGDRMYMVHTAEIEYRQKGIYDNARGSVHEWVIGARYDITDFQGSKVHVHGVYDRGDGTGILAVHYNKTAKYENYTPTVGSLISLDGDVIASVQEAYDVMIPAQNIMGYDNPEYGLDVDITGSANIRFAEGLPQVDAWGKLRVSGATHIGSYVFGQKEKFTDNFSATQLNGGYATYDDNRNSIRVGIDNNAADFVSNEGFAATSSNTYHHYIPGSSHLYMGAARINDPDAVGAVRNWGIFDASNGFFFQVDENGDFNLVVRSSQSGTKVDLVIPRNSFNGDKLDGSGDTQTILQLQNDNVWWIDVQWHGAGRVRFGSFIDGQRVILHSYFHANNFEYAMSQTASLPTCFSIGAVNGPNTNLFIEAWSASLWTETQMDLNEIGEPSTVGTSHFTVTANGSDPWQYLFSLSPRSVLPNGETNHALYVPTSISAYAHDESGTNGLDAIVDLKGEINSVHSGHSFSPVTGTTVELSTSGTSYEFGKITLQEMFRGRYSAELTDTFNNFQYGAIKNFADDGGTIINNALDISKASPAVLTVAAGERLEAREYGDSSAQGGVTFPLNAAEYNGRFEFYDVASTGDPDFGNGVTGTYVYVKPIAYNQAELYLDAALTVPLDTTGYVGDHDPNTGYLKGFRGPRVIWSFYAKTRTALHPGPVKLMVTINWKEVIQ